jgi:hypothetical protein
VAESVAALSDFLRCLAARLATGSSIVDVLDDYYASTEKE